METSKRASPILSSRGSAPSVASPCPTKSSRLATAPNRIRSGPMRRQHAPSYRGRKAQRAHRRLRHSSTPCRLGKWMQVDHVVEQRFILNHPRVTGYEMDRNAIHCALVPANAVVAGILKNAGGPFLLRTPGEDRNDAAGACRRFRCRITANKSLTGSGTLGRLMPFFRH